MKKILLPILLIKGLVSAVNIFDGIQFIKHPLKKVMSQKNNKISKEYTMKNSTFVALVLFLATAIGAIVAAYLYLSKREKELDEYEKLLFSDEFEDKTSDDDKGEDFNYEKQQQ